MLSYIHGQISRAVNLTFPSELDCGISLRHIVCNGGYLVSPVASGRKASNCYILRPDTADCGKPHMPTPTVHAAGKMRLGGELPRGDDDIWTLSLFTTDVHRHIELLGISRASKMRIIKFFAVTFLLTSTTPCASASMLSKAHNAAFEMSKSHTPAALRAALLVAGRESKDFATNSVPNSTKDEPKI
ncbi:hypothetical protein BX600DRAFT_502256 [Xylariales sp. PMI_506]|nr:hypothetical protein BX600DRAFT_502256 [Xylariales sp. PMI_506]